MKMDNKTKMMLGLPIDPISGRVNRRRNSVRARAESGAMLIVPGLVGVGLLILGVLMWR